MFDQKTIQLLAEIFDLLAKYDMDFQDLKKTLEEAPKEKVIDF